MPGCFGLCKRGDVTPTEHDDEPREQQQGAGGEAGERASASEPEPAAAPFVPPTLSSVVKALSAKAAAKVCYYLVSHFFGRSVQYKLDLRNMATWVDDTTRVVSMERLKAYLDHCKIPVPVDKLAPIARYYAPDIPSPPGSPRDNERSPTARSPHGHHHDSDHPPIPPGVGKMLLDVDHLVLDLDKAAMRYYLNKNSGGEEVKPSPQISVAKITELVFKMLVDDPVFGEKEITDEEEVRIEELIASVDMATVCIPVGTRARMVKANMGANLQKKMSFKNSMRQQSVTLLTAIGGAARLPSMVEFIQKATKKPKAEEEEEVAKMAFEVPAWSLRAMQGRQGERIMSLQDHTQKSAPSLTTTASQAAQNMLKKRSIAQQQEILAHAVYGALKAVLLEESKDANTAAPSAAGSGEMSTRESTRENGRQLNSGMGSGNSRTLTSQMNSGNSRTLTSGSRMNSGNSRVTSPLGERPPLAANGMVPRKSSLKLTQANGDATATINLASSRLAHPSPAPNAPSPLPPPLPLRGAPAADGPLNEYMWDMSPQKPRGGLEAVGQPGAKLEAPHMGRPQAATLPGNVGAEGSSYSGSGRLQPLPPLSALPPLGIVNEGPSPGGPGHAAVHGEGGEEGEQAVGAQGPRGADQDLGPAAPDLAQRPHTSAVMEEHAHEEAAARPHTTEDAGQLEGHHRNNRGSSGGAGAALPEPGVMAWGDAAAGGGHASAVVEEGATGPTGGHAPGAYEGEITAAEGS